MASGHTGRMLTYFGSIDKGHDHTVDSPRTRFSGRTKQKADVKDEPEDFTPSRAVVIGQWICFVLGVVCIVSGAFGIFAKYTEGPPPASVAWLGSAYMPALRITALLCLFIGLRLVRRGWSSPDRSKEERR